MSFKLSQVALATIVLAVATVSTQRRIVPGRENAKLHHGVDFKKLLQHLNLHSSDHHDGHTKPAGNAAASNIVNIRNLNLYFGQQLVDKLPAKSGRSLNDCTDAGCKVDSNDGLGNEVQQLLNEMEAELGNVNDKQGDNLRCRGDRCGGGDRCGTGLRCGCRPRSDEREENDENEERQMLRCNDLRCGCRPRSEDRDDEEQEERQQLRCRGTRCGQPTRSNNDLKTELERYGKKYKINEELDAIVLDLNNFNGLLGRLNKKPNGRNKKSEINKRPNANSFDMDYLFGIDDTRSEKKTRPVLINLNQLDDDKQLSREIENTLHRLKLKLRNGDLVRPKESADFERQLQKLQVALQKLGAQSDENKMLELVNKIILGTFDKSEGLPRVERTDYIDVPKWLRNAVKDSQEVLRVKQLFPLTIKQKQKLLKKSPAKSSLRRAARSAQRLGVPFELQVDGLAQVQA